MNPTLSQTEEAMTRIMSAIDEGRGSFVDLLTKFGARYRGFVYHVDSPEFTIALTHAKCFGTERRRMDGRDYPGNEEIYKCIFFRGSEVVDIQFLSPPPATQFGTVPPNYLVGIGPSNSSAGPSNSARPSLPPIGTPLQSASPATIALQASQPVSVPTKQPSSGSGDGLLPLPLALKDTKEKPTHSAPRTRIGLPPRPPPRRVQGEQGATAAVSEGSGARGRGSVGSASRGRGKQVWVRVPEKNKE